MKIRLLMFALAGTIIIGAVFIFGKLNADIYDKEYVLELPNKEISLIVVNNSESRTNGLSGMESLSENKAMLFIFDDSDKYGIWMKDMKFPIDIIWLDENSKIISIEKNILPETYPKVFFPTEKSLYILEVNAGFVEKNNLIVGKVLNFTLK